MRVFAAAWMLAAGCLAPAAGAAIDRHPELKSRAQAWSEFDGSYLVDPGNRAEMLDFFWTVLNRPYPEVGWTGSVNPPVAGGTSELWRIREYAQLNAYRALNGSPPVSEDPTKLDAMQAGALVFAQNPDRELTHVIDQTWIGYNPTAAEALITSLATQVGLETKLLPLWGATDMFITDSAISNGTWVGHRTTLLHDDSTRSTVGAAYDTINREHVAVWNSPIDDQVGPLTHFVAYPAPGYMALGLFRYFANLRWSFVPANDWTAFRVLTDREFYNVPPGLPYKDASVTAKVNGVPVPVHHVVLNNPPGPITWDFNPTVLDLEGDHVADGTKVEISIHDVAERIPETSDVVAYHNYHYTVTFFEENTITPQGVAPRTPLVNLSTRAAIGSGDGQLIAGFSVSGTLPVRVALRTQGPGLAKYGVQHPAGGTQLRVYDAGGRLLGENAGWKQHQDWRLLQSYGLNPSADTEAGMVLTLWPGNYTAVVRDDTGADGVGIIEAFNIDGQTPSRLQNLSTRGLVATNEQAMIAGISVSREARTVVIRTQGPGLARYGLGGVVRDTVLTVVAQNDGHVVATNDDWESDPRNGRLRTDLAGLAPTDPRESALILHLDPGGYTALVSGKNSAGIGIVEMFDVSP